MPVPEEDTVDENSKSEMLREDGGEDGGDGKEEPEEYESAYKQRKKKDQEMEANQIKEVEGEEDTDHALSLSKEEDLGETIEPFNLRDDMDNGFFDPNGNYVWRRRDRDAVVKDAWMESMEDGDGEAASEEAMKKTAAAHAVQRALENREGREDESDDEPFSEQSCLKVVVSILERGESVAKALKRLGGTKTTKVKKHWHKNKKKDDDSAAKNTKAAHKDFVPLTDAANAMLNNGCPYIFQERKEQLVARIEKEIAMWEYKDAQGKIQGPFSTADVVAWRQQGYFTGETAVEMRRVVPVKSADEIKAEEDERASKKVKFSHDNAQDEFDADFDDDDDDDEGGSNKEIKKKRYECRW